MLSLQKKYFVFTITAIASVEAFCLERSHSTRSNAFVSKNTINVLQTTRGGSRTKLNAFEHVHATFGMVNQFYVKCPIASSLLTCAVKASAADYVAQLSTVTNNSPQESHGASQKKLSSPFRFELARNLGFLIYGALYQGVFQHFLYNIWFPQIFGTGKDAMTVMTQIAFDTVMIVPCLCWPIAYVITSLIGGTTLREGMRQYIDDLRNSPLVLNFCLIWIPAKALIFGLIPEQFKIASIALVSFFWTIIFSNICNKSSVENE